MQRELERAILALGQLDSESRLLPDPELFIYAYVRREAQLSSQIEGMQSSLSDLLELELRGSGDIWNDDETEVSNYVAALEHGLHRVREEFSLSNRLIREMQGLLLRSGRGSSKLPSQFRRSQNWIGGTRPGTAACVPPPQQEVERCMAELEQFIHAKDDGISALVRAGLAHAQFESIHPFLDGNGRVGRLLIAFILHQEGVLRQPLLYLSLYLKQHRRRYYDLLSQLRDRGDWEAWIEFFIVGVRETAQDGVRTARQLSQLFDTDRKRIEQSGRRAGSTLQAHDVLKRSPIISIQHVHEQTGLSWPTAASAVKRLTELGIAREITGRSYARLFATALTSTSSAKAPSRSSQSASTLQDTMEQETAMGDTVTYERSGRIATITYNRPEALNAINHELRRDLNAAWEQFRNDDEAWVGIVTGAGRAFSAGADLRSPAPPEEHTFWEVPSLTSIESGMEVWKPTIAAVNGYALGFGLTLVAACDFVIASDRAQFGFPEVQIGVPTIQGSIRMPKRIAWHYAMELLLIGDRVDAWRAKEMGLVWEIVPHDDLMPAARNLAQRLCKGAPLAVRATKEVAHRGQELPFVQAIRFGETMRRVARETADAAEGPQAFREKRAPDWGAH